MRVLSLFDGISCARVALGDSCTTYYASEIDPKAIEIAKKNYSDTIHVGSVVALKGEDFKDIDLLIGGSPCTDLSIAKKGRQGLDGSHSQLFWEYLRLLREIKPKWFVLENVASMPKKDKDLITQELGVEPIMINAALVSAQSRKRLFWTNIPVQGLPEDRGILLKHIIQPDSEIDERMMTEGKAYCLTEKNSVEFKQQTTISLGHIGNSNAQANRVYSEDGKSCTLSANGGGLGAKTGLYSISNSTIRKLTPIECERLQSLPDNYTEGIAKTHRYRCLGNAFNVEVIKFILSFIE